MSGKKAILLSVAAGLLISAFAAVLLLKTSAQPEAARREVPKGGRVLSPEPVAIERPLPEARLADLEGKEMTPEELRRGRYLLVFLTTSCGPCVDEAQAISRIVGESPTPIRVYGVGVERPAQVATFVKEYDLKFPFLHDKDSTLREAFDVRRFPTKLLVEDGVVKQAWYGKTTEEARLRSELALVEVK
jgi:peroxiredoxin